MCKWEIEDSSLVYFSIQQWPERDGMKYFHAGYSGDCSYCVYAVVIQEAFWEQKSRIEEGGKDVV